MVSDIAGTTRDAIEETLDIDGVLNSNFWNESHQTEISNGTLIDEEKSNC